jgi:methylmalonyl-CoA mutase cobalamin-binding subunit
MKKILGAALGGCVHIAGLNHFLKLAESEGYQTVLLGPAVPVERIIKALRKEKPEVLALSYRLTPEVAGSLFAELQTALNQIEGFKPVLIFGGTPPVAEVARNTGMFDMVFDGSESADAIRAYLKGTKAQRGEHENAGNLIARILQKYPYPVIRHHFGRPFLDETIAGIKEIAESEVLDVISIGPDQNAQECFFRPSEMDPAQTGAGGVPVRTPEDMRALYEASRCGNFPLMRCYAGTRDLMQWARMSVDTIRNAWGAIPLCWYSVIDGRSDRSLEDAIAENQSVMKWYAGMNIPVEVNESHQWSLRDAHDGLAVAMAYLAAYNAMKMGVHHYVAQFMFNTPPGTDPSMDLAKMMAKLEMITELENESFTVYREVRAGIAHFSPIAEIAKGQLAASALISLFLKPHIVHVVSFSEGDHATTPAELIESCRIVQGVIRNCLRGLPDISEDQRIQARKKELIRDARNIVTALMLTGHEKADPLTDPATIAKAIRNGILDAPHFRGNPFLNGSITTGLVNGAWDAIDPGSGEVLAEEKRLAAILTKTDH